MLKIKNLTSGSICSLLSLGRTKARPLTATIFKNLSAYDKDFTDREITHRLTQDLINERILGLPDKANQSMSGPNFINMRLTQLGRNSFNFIAIRKT